jgi:hypothetical protein
MAFYIRPERIEKIMVWLRCLISHDWEFRGNFFVVSGGDKPWGLHKCKRCGKTAAW